MKYEVLERRGSKELNLFFAGWGMDASPFRGEQSGLWSLADRSFDTAMVYDYTDLNFPLDRIESYDRIYLIAWSMGVWAAEQIALPHVVDAVAINGTGAPVDNERGIPIAIFEGTLAGLSEESLLAFYRRMCGSRALLSGFLERRPLRSIDSLRTELAAIGLGAERLSPHPKDWTRAIVGEHDRIFPAEHQIRYWQGRAVPTTWTSNHHLL